MTGRCVGEGGPGVVGRTSLGEIVSKLLSQVPVSDTAQLWSSPPGWILPLRKEDLCMDDDSVLSVETEVRTTPLVLSLGFHAAVKGFFDATDLPAERVHHLHLFALVGTDQPDVDLIRAAPPEKVLVKRVCVLEFIRMGVDCRQGPVRPEEVDFSGEGGEP